MAIRDTADRCPTYQNVVKRFSQKSKPLVNRQFGAGEVSCWRFHALQVACATRRKFAPRMSRTSPSE